MSSFFLPRLLSTHPVTCGLGIGLASSTLLHFSKPAHRRVLFCDADTVASTSPSDWSFSQYKAQAKTPLVRQDGKLNAGAVRQITKGSIAGVICGLAISVFSKTLALLLGLTILGIQAAESRGIHLIPYGRLQGYFKNVDLRSAVQDNVAFKLSFGATFALAGFARLE